VYQEAPIALLASLALATAASASTEDRFNSAKLSQMDEEIQRAIAEHKLPGGVLWVECKGSNYHKAFGFRSVFPTSEAMTEDTIFDVASLTKVLATVPALMVLYERGKVKLDEPVFTYLPEFKGGGKEAITIRHLLTHTSGFGRSLSNEPDWSDFKTAFSMVCAQSLSEPPGAAFRYSDLNFIILGELVQRLAGVKLDEFCAREIFKPLNMADTCFLPSPAVLSRVAPTEKVGRTVLRGAVHDFKAQAMGGVAGHAGLFTTAADVARFARMILNQGKLDGTRILKAETVNLMTSVQSPKQVRARRGLGWDIDSDFSRPRGDLFPIGSFGHSGFTGVCLWIDPFSQTFWMFLSNRIHPDPSGNIYPLQNHLATLAAEAVNGFDFRNVPEALPPQSTNHERSY
jgi:CubicO group peptidase (beta-lactamase class C family)